ncbi:cation-translocating P-type ATPase [Candidatus Micrarchaeota archaeon]|nr:cation-translocating P-type ATPase [Candidatus Micrarchaeota archaeon]MBU2477222.1 cation-translocating P-type ATPase [Candidatus Micrarchaeota archaeon]
MKVEEVLKQLESNSTGLTEEKAENRLKKYGFNELKEKKKITLLKILLRQFSNFLVWVLFAAAFTSYFIGEILSFWATLFIIAFIILAGFIQEFKAEKAMDALKRIVKPTTKVIRNNKVKKILTRELVLGDIVLLETGDKIPADAKILEVIGLKADESALTGESQMVEKAIEDIIFAGTSIVHGKCKAVVFATGMQTKLGKIAEMIQVEEEKTPLQIKITRLAKTIAMLALVACTLIFFLGIFKGAPVAAMLVVALALAVAAVPEGLPLTLTVTLSLGMHNMAKHNAVIRRMLAVETLGSTTVICTDKTGTLTKNEMTVEKIFVNDMIVDVKGTGYNPKGDFFVDKKKISPADKTMQLMFRTGALCNNAFLEQKKGKWEILGDPTEAALVVLAAKAGEWKDDLEAKNQRLEEIIFTSERKMMSCVHKTAKEKMVFAKGAPEIILEKCVFIQKNGKTEKLSKQEKEKILKMNEQFAADALRVLGFAYKEISLPLTPENIEKELVFLGLAAMIDPPREEVKNAIETCKTAGIKTVMITGDNKHTAKAIAKEIGLLNDDNQRIVTGKELNEMKDKEFEEIVEHTVIYARTHPEHKMRIVQTLQKKGHIVAMTGDGINDAPAVKKADIGIAMGIKGTDVTKESADMILIDDNFATIVDAVKGGRTIYENIRKFTTYLLSRNFTEVILIFIGIALFDFDFLPLLALQILFINSFDEVMPSLALGAEPARKGIMKMPPRNPKERFLVRKNTTIMLCMAGFMALIALAVFIYSDPAANIDKARTMVFATIVGMVIFIPSGFRSLEEPIHKIGLFSNKWIFPATVSVAIITLIVMHVPFFQKIFKFTTLNLFDWVICISAAFTAFVFLETLKFIINRKRSFNL